MTRIPMETIKDTNAFMEFIEKSCPHCNQQEDIENLECTTKEMEILTHGLPLLTYSGIFAKTMESQPKEKTECPVCNKEMTYKWVEDEYILICEK